MKKTMRVFCGLLLLFPFIVCAQNNKSEILFEKNINWEDVKAKAKAQNKYIFVDCFATWCTPCKYMDKEVYTSAKVATFVNEQFISVKIQMDTSKADKEDVKKWYSDAREIAKKYKISGYPTYLFFSPSGEIVHKDVGAKRVDDFIIVAKTALDTKKQYYTLVADYKQGKKDYTVLPFLAKTAQVLKENDIANSVAKDYINNYLFLLAEAELYNKSHIEFISTFTRDFSERGFKFFYNNQKKIDSFLKQEGFAQGVVDRVIYQREIFPWFKKADQEKGAPDWNKIAKSIKKKFNGLYADRNVTNAQVIWYRYKEQWPQYVKSATHQIERYGVSDGELNNIVWYGIFLHSNKKEDIGAGIKWMEELINRNDSFPNAYDTYANLLYKAGRVEDAIAAEEKALKMAPNSKDMLITLQKMRRGEVTWIIPEKKNKKK